MKFIVLNFILLIGYFAYIENSDVINDFKTVKSENLESHKKLTFSEYNNNKLSVSDHIEKDVQDLNNYRKDMLQKVDHIQKTFSANEGVRKIAQKLNLKPKKEKAIDSEFLEELKKKYSPKNN